MVAVSSRSLVLVALTVSCSPFGGSDARATDGGTASDAAVASSDAAVVPAAPPSAYADLVLKHTPVLYWRLGETSGTFLDRSGGGHPGEEKMRSVDRDQASLLEGDGDRSVRIRGATIAAVPSKALYFPGLAPYSIELWIRIDVVPTATTDILTIADGSNGIGLYFEAGKLLSSRYESDKGKSHGGKSLTIKVPHHVVTTYDGDELRMFIDGYADDNDLTKTDTPLDAHSYAVTIGRQKAGANPLDAFIDEVAIYDYDLQKDVIAQHYEVGAKR